jgi:metal-responsive CopG/Arc/MetJ family transcriptional regulator
MKTVQMTLDEQLVKAVDSAARKLGTTRSGFTREALRAALKEVRLRDLKSKQRDGYRRNRSSAASLATGNQSRCGVIDEARRG